MAEQNWRAMDPAQTLGDEIASEFQSRLGRSAGDNEVQYYLNFLNQNPQNSVRDVYGMIQASPEAKAYNDRTVAQLNQNITNAGGATQLQQLMGATPQSLIQQPGAAPTAGMAGPQGFSLGGMNFGGDWLSGVLAQMRGGEFENPLFRTRKRSRAGQPTGPLDYYAEQGYGGGYGPGSGGGPKLVQQMPDNWMPGQPTGLPGSGSRRNNQFTDLFGGGAGQFGSGAMGGQSTNVTSNPVSASPFGRNFSTRQMGIPARNML
jgi:hypothetical protein